MQDTVIEKTQQPAAAHASFRLDRTRYLSSLKVDFQEFTHIATGAKHYHLASQSNENVFLVGFKTVPDSDNGVAHILEHTSLCGSKKYPVRDPFFMMSRRSLNTFMNALTSSDWTAYPFASMNNKDFNNLLDVYLDAVFFSRLDPLDFAQEGHRLEFKEPTNPESPLEFKGVVYNEMKGAMSSVVSQLWHTLTKYLYPSNTYHYNSGGDPQSIPDLTYEQLQTFYQKYYHPSNSLFMTFGNTPASELQAKFEQQALSQFEQSEQIIDIANTKRYFAPVRVQESYAYAQPDYETKSHVVVAWLLGSSINTEEALRVQLISSLLLDNSASPLLRALESTPLGTSPSPLCGHDDSQKEMTFIAGLEGCKASDADAIEALIIDTLKTVAEDGIPQEDIDAALHQLELHQKEVGGDSYPYGLQLLMSSLSSCIHGGDPVAQLDLDASLKQLREDIKDPAFLSHTINTLFLNNAHQVRLTLVPDAALQNREEQAEKTLLENIQKNLTDEQTAQLVSDAQALLDRQDQEDDESLLPKVTLRDVPSSESAVSGESVFISGDIKLTQYSAGTNGLCYQQFIYPLAELTDEQTALLPIYSQCISELGVNELDYLATQKWQAQVTGGLSAFSSIRTGLNDLSSLQGYFCYSGKALSQNHTALTDIMKTTIDHVRFDEPERIQDLVAQISAYKEQSITSNGHSLAMTAATAQFNAQAKLNHSWSGLESIQAIKALDNALKQENGAETVLAQFQKIHTLMTTQQPQVLLVAEPNALPAMAKTLDATFADHSESSAHAFTKVQPLTHVKQAWLTQSQVNFCAKAYPTVEMNHPDAAALVVLGGLMRNSFLHKAIREQGGAYGGGASQDSGIGAFKFYSYRDPRLVETLNDFDACIDWALTTEHSTQKIEEAILGVISSIDRTESPAGKAKRCFYQDLHDRTPETRQRFRERVLNVTSEQLKSVTQTYLKDKPASIAVICDVSQANALTEEGFDVNHI